MSPTLITADLHVSSNPRDAYRWKFVEETLPALVAEHGVARVLVLGDLTEAKAGHSAELVNRLVDALAALAERASVYLLKGNHDYLAEDVPFYRFTRHVPRVRWINIPTILKLRDLGQCMFLPHTNKPETWADLDVQANRCDWYFCHQTFDGAVSESGQKMAGFPWRIFPRGARVISGDVHGPQELGPVTYVGAPYTVDFGDDYEPRVLLLDGAKMRSVPVPGPQKRLMTLSGRNPLTALGMKHPLGALDPIRPGDVIKIRVELPAGSETSRTEVRAQVREWAADAGVQLYAVEVIAPKASPTKPARDRHRASDADLVRGYAKKMGAGKAAVAAGLKLMEDVA